MIVVISFLLARARAAQDPSRPRGPSLPVYMSQITCKPVLGPFGEPVKMVMSFEFSQVDLQASGKLETKVLATIEHDLMAGSGHVIIGDTVYEDREVAAVIEAVALREYRETFPSALPTRKKGLRTVPQ